MTRSLLPDDAPNNDDRLPLAAIRDAIAKLRFGAVVLTVHDGRLVQMEVTERQRFA